MSQKVLMKRPSRGHLMQYKNPANRELVLEGLAYRLAVWILIGYGRKMPDTSVTRNTIMARIPRVFPRQTIKNHPKRKPSAIHISRKKQK